MEQMLMGYPNHYLVLVLVWYQQWMRPAMLLPE
jgi:hypothetical protein